MKLVAVAHGGAADSVFDLARVLRMPGTVNHKDPTAPVATKLQVRDGSLRTLDAVEAAQTMYDVSERSWRSAPRSTTSATWEWPTSTCACPNYCHRVTADDGLIGDQHLREFQDNEKTIPTILTTSQKLSTGVDAVNVRNIVLMRPINLMIEFKQIIGRGTRLYDGKYYFTIPDFVKAHHHFNDPEWDGDPIDPQPPVDPKPPPGPKPPPDDPDPNPPRPKKVRVKLADGKERTIDPWWPPASGVPTGSPCRRSSSSPPCTGRCRACSGMRTSCAGCGANQTPGSGCLSSWPRRAMGPTSCASCRR